MEELKRDQIERLETRLPALKALNVATLDKPRGYAIPKAEAVALCGGEKEFSKVAKHWKNSVLWLLGITVEYDHKTRSYRFPETKQQVVDRQDRLSRAAEKKHREEAIRLGVIRDADMESDHQRQLRILQMNQHSDLAGKINSQREFARLALQQPETLPRINGAK